MGRVKHVLKETETAPMNKLQIGMAPKDKRGAEGRAWEGNRLVALGRASKLGGTAYVWKQDHREKIGGGAVGTPQGTDGTDAI